MFAAFFGTHIARQASPASFFKCRLVSGSSTVGVPGGAAVNLAMDWEGQRLAEQLMQYMLVASALLAFLTGYCTSSYSTMLYIYLAGVVVTSLVAVPDWPCFNRHSFTWLEPECADKPSERVKARQQAAGKKGTKSQAKR